MNRFFEDLGRRFVRAAAERGVEVEAPGLEPAVAQELLDFARVAAHSQERRFAPLATYLAGVAAERLRQAGGPATPEALVEMLREIRGELEAAASAG